MVLMNNFQNKFEWEKLGRILAPDPRYPWMSTVTGSSFALLVEDGPLCDVYVTGRDDKNRSQIGVIRMNLEEPGSIQKISDEALLPLGDLGAFDENGVAYPCLVQHHGQIRMYYVGWMPTVLTPCQTHIGLAVLQANGKFKRVSRAPVLERTNEDYLSMGSCCVIYEDNKFRMWYTSYLKWGKTANEPKHIYVIKYAESADGVNWKRNNQVCIDIHHDWEFAICRPTVIKSGGYYHMWYATRGEHYRIGYASSKDGIDWTRRDDLAGIALSESGWDSLAVTYPHVFQCRGKFYMLYNGNDYGRQGLGLARLKT